MWNESVKSNQLVAAYVPRRFIAFVIDAVIFWLLVVLWLAITNHPSVLANGLIYLVYKGIGPAVLSGRTLGRLVTGLRVVASNGPWHGPVRIVARELPICLLLISPRFGLLPGVVLLFSGLLWLLVIDAISIAVRRDHRSLRDLVFGTAVTTTSGNQTC